VNRLTRLAILVGLALLPWPRLTAIPGLTRAQWADGAFLVAMVAALPALRRHRSRLDPRWAVWALGAYLAWSALSLAVTDDLGEGLRLLGVRVFTAALFALFLHVIDDVDLQRWVARVVAANALVIGVAAAGAFLLFRAGHPTAFIGSYGTLQPSSEYARIQVGTRNPNWLASYSLFSLAVVLAFRDRLPAWLWKAAAMGSVIALLATLSKTVVAAPIILVTLAVRGRRRGWVMALTVVAASAVLVAASTWQVRVDPHEPWRWSFGGRPERADLILTSAKDIVRHPLFGSGLGDLLQVDAASPPKRPHLTLLDIAGSSGVPALACLALFGAGCWIGRRRPANVVLWGGVAALMVDGLRQDVTNLRHVWIAAAMAVAVRADPDGVHEAGSSSR
jgi:hypothetical protein